jgi:hypothetical protein
MTLPLYPSPISFQDIKTEFNDTDPVNIQDYYAGGALVPSGTTGKPYPGSATVSVPTSGTISLDNFYGATSVSIVQITTSGTWIVPTGVTSIRVLSVAGGGGGGHAAPADGGGGGGAGGVIYNTAYSVTPGASVSVIIGAGGAGGAVSAASVDGVNVIGPIQPNRGTAGSSTTFGTLTAIGGGYGGGDEGGSGSPSPDGGAGGSGGGANGRGGGHPGGTGTSGQGNNGGSAGGYNNGGGGGGYAAQGQATENQTNSIDSVNGKGGTGLTVVLPTNSTVYPYNATTHAYSTAFLASSIQVGGGGGGGQGYTPTAGYPGNGGGGSGGLQGFPGASGVARSGGGGGGGGAAYNNGGNGGSGAVYIIYPTVPVTQGVVNNYDTALAVNDYSEQGNTVTAGITLNSNGTVSTVVSPAIGSYNSIGTKWYSTTTAGIGSSYYAYATVVVSYTNGSTGSFSGTYNTWVSLASGQTWSLINTPPAQPAYATSNKWVVIATITINIAATPGGSLLGYSTFVVSSKSSELYTPDPTPITCFPAGSMVMMANGSVKAIELLVAGDMLMGPAGPTAVISMETPMLGSRKLLQFADGHTWSEEHAHWTRDSASNQWWWSANADMWRHEVAVGAIGGLIDNSSIRTGDGHSYAHIDGWKAQQYSVVDASASLQLYTPITDGTPVIVDGYLVGAGVNQAGYDYTKLDWNAVMSNLVKKG